MNGGCICYYYIESDARKTCATVANVNGSNAGTYNVGEVILMLSHLVGILILLLLALLPIYPNAMCVRVMDDKTSMCLVHIYIIHSTLVVQKYRRTKGTGRFTAQAVNS